MKTKLKTLSLLLGFSLLFISCASNNPADQVVDGTDSSAKTESTEQVEQPQQPENISYVPDSDLVEYLPTAENVKFLGRSILEDDELLMCFSSTGAEFQV